MSKMRKLTRRCSGKALRGFTLFEIVIVLLILGFLASMAAMVAKSLFNKQQYSTTRTRLSVLDVALVSYVATTKRLPCPADGTIAQGTAGAGTEAGGPGTCLNNEQTGVVPWVTLGLTEDDATDGWGRRFTYRVPLNLTGLGALDLSNCDPVGGVSTASPGTCPACTQVGILLCWQPSAYLCGKGFQIQNVATIVQADPNTTVACPATGPPPAGAAYVVISHGETGGAAYLSSGSLQPLTGAEGPQELQNINGQALVAYYVDDGISSAPHFGDIVIRSSVQSVATRAGLGPRSFPAHP